MKILFLLIAMLLQVSGTAAALVTVWNLYAHPWLDLAQSGVLGFSGIALLLVGQVVANGAR